MPMSNSSSFEANKDISKKKSFPDDIKLECRYFIWHLRSDPDQNVDYLFEIQCD